MQKTRDKAWEYEQKILGKVRGGAWPLCRGLFCMAAKLVNHPF